MFTEIIKKEFLIYLETKYPHIVKRPKGNRLEVPLGKTKNSEQNKSTPMSFVYQERSK